MEPTLADGAQVLVAARRTPLVGDIVVARHPFKRNVLLIKRIDAFDLDGRAHLLGDNPGAGTDSRSLGNLPRDLIVGTVTARF